MKYDELQVRDEDLHTEIFLIFDAFNIKNYKNYKKLNIIKKLKVENNIVEILKIHDEDESLKNKNNLKDYIITFINSYNHLNYIGGK